MFLDKTPEYYSNLQGKSGSQLIMAPADLHVLRMNAAVSLLAKHIPPKISLIDMGCGYGVLLDHLPASLCATYIGVDPSHELIDLARFHHPETQPVTFLLGGLEDMYNKISADYVVCLGVAAHLISEYKYLQEFAGKLSSMATRGVVVEFQNREKYKGYFSSWTKTEVSNAFCRRLLPDYTVENEQDSTFTCCISLL